jgi:hypothetical protein
MTGAQRWWGSSGGGIVTIGAGRAMTADLCGNAVARNLSSGAVAWTHTEGLSCTSEDDGAFDGQRLWSPDRQFQTTDPGGRIYDATGTLTRRFLGQTPAFDHTRAFVIRDGVVDPRLTALDRATGTDLWTASPPPDDRFTTAPLVVDGAVLVGTEDGMLLALDPATGAITSRSAIGASAPYLWDWPGFALAAGYGMVIVPTSQGVVGMRAVGSDSDTADTPGGSSGDDSTPELTSRTSVQVAVTAESGEPTSDPRSTAAPLRPRKRALSIVPGQALGDVLRRGLRVRALCTRACRIRWTATAGRDRARGRASLAARRPRTVRVKLPAPARVGLRTGEPVSLRLDWLTAAGAATWTRRRGVMTLHAAGARVRAALR